MLSSAPRWGIARCGPACRVVWGAGVNNSRLPDSTLFVYFAAIRRLYSRCVPIQNQTIPSLASTPTARYSLQTLTLQ